MLWAFYIKRTIMNGIDDIIEKGFGEKSANFGDLLDRMIQDFQKTAASIESLKKTLSTHHNKSLSLEFSAEAIYYVMNHLSIVALQSSTQHLSLIFLTILSSHMHVDKGDIVKMLWSGDGMSLEAYLKFIETIDIEANHFNDNEASS